MNSREKEICTKGVDEKGFKIQYGDTDVAITGGTAHGEQKFALDKVFDPDCMQKDIFDHVAQRTIDDILSGFNGTLFAYGQTGSGKTFTMMGPDISGDPALNGIIPRSSLQIFDHIEGDDTGTEFVIKCSYMEIYNEQIHDLRVKGHDNLQIREHPTRGIYVDGLSETPISSPEDIVRLINIGALHRATAATNITCKRVVRAPRWCSSSPSSKSGTCRGGSSRTSRTARARSIRSLRISSRTSSRTSESSP